MGEAVLDALREGKYEPLIVCRGVAGMCSVTNRHE
jgi:hypothetical protein